jgi:lipid A ethanolaminephosphotransferase
LFRVTEFAESVFQSPLSHRTSLHPLWVMLGVALWIATVGHWPLWQTLLQAGTGAASPAMLAALAAQLALGALLWLALFGWRWSLKTAITLLLLWAALGSCAMWLQRAAGEAVAMAPGALLAFYLKGENWARLQSWPCVATLLGVAVLPAVLIWRGRVRRIPFVQRLFLIVLLVVAAVALLAVLDGRFSHTLPSPLDPLAIWQSLGKR